MLNATDKYIKITVEIVCQLNEIADMELYESIEKFQEYGEAEITGIETVEYSENV